MIDLINKLSKLKIEVFDNESRSSKVAELEAMYNPESLSMRFESVFQTEASSETGKWHGTNPKQLTVKLIFDGTAVSSFGLEQLIPGQVQTVSQRVQDFLARCYTIQGEIHEPNFLRLSWGSWPSLGNSLSSGFDCRLKSVDIKYTSFDRDGTPLRAELNATFLEQLEPAKQAAELALGSPDISHRHTIRDGDTLPALCARIYGSTHHYLAVAHFNDLDHIRFLIPGNELLFPPLDQLEEGDT